MFERSTRKIINDTAGTLSFLLVRRDDFTKRENTSIKFVSPCFNSSHVILFSRFSFPRCVCRSERRERKLKVRNYNGRMFGCELNIALDADVPAPSSSIAATILPRVCHFNGPFLLGSQPSTLLSTFPNSCSMVKQIPSLSTKAVHDASMHFPSFDETGFFFLLCRSSELHDGFVLSLLRSYSNSSAMCVPPPGTLLFVSFTQEEISMLFDIGSRMCTDGSSQI